MISIYDVSLLDLLPDSLKQDPQVVAMAKAFDKELQAIAKQLDQGTLLARIDELPEAALDHLLWQFHITFNEGLGLANTVEEKRGLLKKAIEIHRLKGTKAALEMVLEMLNMRGIISEWFEYEGDPYHFKIEIIEVTNKGLSGEVLFLLDKLVEEYKNIRSWLEAVNIYLTGSGGLNIANIVQSGEFITVYPWTVKEIVGSGAFTLAVTHQSVETISVYPEV